MTRTTFLTIAALLIAQALHAQGSLTALEVPLVIDFTNSVAGVNNGPFAADEELGETSPSLGQLDTDAWDYLYDGSEAQARNNASTFPGVLPQGQGIQVGGEFLTGVNAVEIGGLHCFGIQPTGGHFTAGSLTLRLQNNSGGPIQQVAVTYDLHVFNDRDRSNAYTLWYSTTNALGTYVELSATQVVTPLDADTEPQWVTNAVSGTITGVSIPAGGELYLRWVGNDVDGSGQRDEVAIGNIQITPQQPAGGPTLIASVAALPAFFQALGEPSAAQSITVDGFDLLSEVLVSVGTPFEVSLSEGEGYGPSVQIAPVGGVVNGVPIYVRMNSPAAGNFNSTVTALSVGSNMLQIAATGQCSDTGLPTLFINELMSSNSSTITDPNGEFDDWIEIYNPNDVDVDLAGWFITDDLANLTKYQFDPEGNDAVVPANGWLIIWADNQSAQGNLHTNFALSASGEAAALVGPDGVTVLDQIEFGPLGADISYGRETDGGLPWVQFTSPTPGASNNTASVAEIGAPMALKAWPVPSAQTLFLSRPVDAWVMDLEGRMVATVARQTNVDIAALRPGMYVLRTLDGAVLRFVKE